MHIRHIDQPGEWDALLLSLPNPHLLQSWQWGEFKGRHGWTPSRLAFERDGRVVAAASVLARRAKPLPLTVLYAPKGPVMDYGDEALAAEVLAALEAHARATNGLFVKLDPDGRADMRGGIARALARHGWIPGDEVQFRGTMLLDLTRSDDELLAAMKPKTRYNIRVAARKGVTVRAGTVDDLPMLYQMYAETSVRDGFVIRPYEYYCDAWQRFMENGLAEPLIAEVGHEPIAAVILYRFGRRAYYLYGASRTVHRDKMPNYLLQWEAIRWAKAQGCTVYDLWGAPDDLPCDDCETPGDDPLAGVYRFKQGFAAQYTRWIGAYDYPVTRTGYWAYQQLMPRLLDAMRRRGQARIRAQVGMAQ